MFTYDFVSDSECRRQYAVTKIFLENIFIHYCVKNIQECGFGNHTVIIIVV